MMELNKKRSTPAARVTLLYVLFAGIWIIASDWLLGFLVQNSSILTRLQTVKGWLFVLTSAVLLYFVLIRENRARDKAEERYHQLVKQAADGIFIADLDGKILEVNPSAAAMAGYPTQDLVGLVLPCVVPNAEHELVPFDSDTIKTDEALRTEGFLVKKDGVRLPVDISANRLKNGSLQAIVRDITLQKQAESDLQQQIQRLAALRAIDIAITSNLDLQVTLDVLLDQLSSQLGVGAAAILLLNPYTEILEYVAGRGFRTEQIRTTVIHPGEGVAGRAIQSQEILRFPNLENVKDQFLRRELLEEEDFSAYYAFPLVTKGQVKGLLEVFQRFPFPDDSRSDDFLEALAGQTAIAIDNSTLYERLQVSNQALMKAYDATLEGWSKALELRDRETHGHTRRVTELTLKMAGEMGIEEKDLVHVRRGTLLHDIGKMGIPDSILLKRGPLTSEEWNIMRRHPSYAFEMLSSINYLRPALDIPYCHHEHWDGTGYPRGLRGEQIPLSARIFSVVDVWDALLSNRPYRGAWPLQRVRRYLQEKSSIHFDPQVVNAFLKLVD